MKCGCGKEAAWLLIDFAAYDALFTPLCDADFEEVCHIEGEMNIDFERVESLTVEDVIKKANEATVFERKRYRSLLDENRALKEIAGKLIGERVTFGKAETKP